MPTLKYVGPLATPFGVALDHQVIDFDPLKQRELVLSSEREVAMLLEREPDLWEAVGAAPPSPGASLAETQDGAARSKRTKPNDAESVSDGAQ